MRHSPLPDETHDNKAARGSGLHRRSSTARHAAPAGRLAPWSTRLTLSPRIRAVVAPFVATISGGRAARIAVASGVLSCLGLAALAQGPAYGSDYDVAASVAAERALTERASRSAQRGVGIDGILTGTSAVGAGSARFFQTQAEIEAKAAAARKAAAAKAAAAKKAAAEKAAAARKIKPVGWLNQKQMDNAQRIVNEGKRLGMPRKAWIAAVACAMQESRLLNLASTVLPESYRYPHEGQGSDHDSVGLFQQRPSSGWGSVKQIMTPAYSARQFYNGLKSVPGWQNMSLTYAIQAVQISAYPEAYAKHVSTATTVVNAITR